MLTTRRKFFGFLAAPAILRVTKPMALWTRPEIIVGIDFAETRDFQAYEILTVNMITREAVRLWKNSNHSMKSIDTQYDSSFASPGAKIGDTLKIKLPNRSRI